MIVKEDETSTPQGWKIKPIEKYKINLKGEEIEGPEWKNLRGEEKAKYRKDNSTGLWMIPESNPSKVAFITEEDFKKGQE